MWITARVVMSLVQPSMLHHAVISLVMAARALAAWNAIKVTKIAPQVRGAKPTSSPTRITAEGVFSQAEWIALIPRSASMVDVLQIAQKAWVHVVIAPALASR